MKALKTVWNRDNGCCLLIHSVNLYTSTWNLIDSRATENKAKTKIAMLDNAQGPMISNNMIPFNGVYLNEYKLW